MTALKAHSLHTKNPRRTRLQSKKRLAVNQRQPELLNQAKCGKFVLFLFQPSAKTSAEVVCKIVDGITSLKVNIGLRTGLHSM